MNRIRIAAAALFGIAASVSTPVAGGRSQWAAVARPAPDDLDTAQLQVDAAKAAMMADPRDAFGKATAATRLLAAMPQSVPAILALAAAHWLQGEALIRLNQPRQADPLLGEALRQVERYQPNSKLHADLLQSAGSVAATLGRVQQAMSDFQHAHSIFAKLNEARGQAMALTYIGMIYYDAGDYEHFLKYQEQAAEVYAADPAFVVSSHNNRGNALRALNRFGEAEVQYRAAYEAARRLDSPLLEARILTNLAAAQELSGKLAAADASVEAGLRIAANGKAADWRPFLWGVKAEVAFKRGQLAAAAQYIGRTFAGADLGRTSMPYREFHEFAHTLYTRLGDDKLALAHLEAFKRLDDEGRTLAASTTAALMAARFDFANQDLRITKLKTGQLERDVLIAKSRARLHRLIMAGVIVAFVLLLIGYLSIRRSRNEVRAANGNLSSANSALEKALKAKTEFLATTSHEIRTPLNGILGMTQVMLHDPAVAGPLRERIQVVHGAGETMRALVDDILDAAKMETGKLAIHRTEMDLRTLLEDIVRLWSGQARTKGITLDLELGDCPARIVEDETRLRQILFNLLSNALKFTEQGGVRISVVVTPEAAGETLRIRIDDSGIGIPPDQLAQIFESFHQVDGGVTRKYGGTGLGLAICRNLSRAMGGDVTVESRIGEGSSFLLTLPLVRVTAPQAAAHASEAGAGWFPLADCRLLLVDRNPLAQSIIRAVLENEVAAFGIADNGEEAIRLIGEGNFDEIVIEGASAVVGELDRFESIRAIAAAAPDASLTLLWADLTESDREAILRAGAARVLAKPIAAKTLLEALKSARTISKLGDEDGRRRSAA